MGYYEFKEADALEFARASGIQTKKRGDIAIIWALRTPL